MKTYRFIKEGDEWFIDLPEYLALGGLKGDLQMVEGADTMLDAIAAGAGEATLTMAREPFDGADELVLTEKCDPIIGGGYYLLQAFQGKLFNQNMWLCQVTEYVFGGLPERIYVRQEAKP